MIIIIHKVMPTRPHQSHNTATISGPYQSQHNSKSIILNIKRIREDYHHPFSTLQFMSKSSNSIPIGPYPWP